MAEPTAEERRRARAAATVKIIRPGEEAAAALEDARYWEHIPLSKRAEFIWQLSVEVFSLAAGGKVIPDFLDLLEALLAVNARFLVVGGYAVGIHGHPRATKDLDVWVEASDQNAPRVLAALRNFGAPLHGTV